MTELMVSIAVNVLLGVVAVLLVLAYRRRLRSDVRLDDSGAALAAFRTQFPDASGTVTLVGDGRSALLELDEDRRIGLLQRHGDRWIARVLTPGEIAAADGRQTGVIRLQFADYGWPRTLLRIDDAQRHAEWLGRLQALAAHSSESARSDLSRA